MTSLFTGSYVAGETSSSVYEWSGEREEWTLHGNIIMGRSDAGVSLVSLSSGVLNWTGSGINCADNYAKEAGAEGEGAERNKVRIVPFEK